MANPKIKVKMKGSTQWLVRPNDEIYVEEKLAHRWQRSGLAVIVDGSHDMSLQKKEPAESEAPETALSLEELRDLAKANDLAIRGTKAELSQRLLDAGIDLTVEAQIVPEDTEPEDEPEELPGWEENKEPELI